MTRILVIEDTPGVRAGIVETLELNNYDVLTAGDGLEGLQVAREALPDVIICDVMMPELNGYEVLRELRNDSKTALIPFIFLTAKNEKPDVRMGMELGADDYLTKPFKELHLLGAIKTRLEKRAVLEAQQLRTFWRKFVRMQEEERHSLARKFQDNIAQPLTGLKLSLHGVDRLSTQELDQKLAEIQQLADTILTKVTHAVDETWPIILEELGLLPALLQQFDQCFNETGIRVNFAHSGLDAAFSQDIKIAAYRITEEVLSNVSRYAQVNEVQISIWTEDGMLRLDIRDNGVGFDLDQVMAVDSASGLLGLRERVSALAGELTILSQPGEGVQIMAQLPLIEVPTPRMATETDIASQMLASPKHIESKRVAQARRASSPQTIVVSIADENKIIREGLKRVFDSESDFQVAGEAARRDDVLRVVRDIQPTVLVLGITMSGVSNLDLLQPATRFLPDLRVIIFSNQSADMYIYEAQRSGASGYIMNNVDSDHLIEAVRVVARGDTYWPSHLSEDPMSLRTNGGYHNSDPEMAALNTLSAREREILVMIGQGSTSKQIANLLSISPRTAETHRMNITRKLGLRMQGDLIRYTIKHGLVTTDQ